MHLVVASVVYIYIYIYIHVYIYIYIHTHVMLMLLCNTTTRNICLSVLFKCFQAPLPVAWYFSLIRTA